MRETPPTIIPGYAFDPPSPEISERVETYLRAWYTVEHLYPAHTRRELDYNQTIVDLDPEIAKDLTPLQRASLAAHGSLEYGALVSGFRVYISGSD